MNFMTMTLTNKVKNAHQFSEENGIHLITLEYVIPNEVGQEKATVTLSYNNEVCCELIGFDLK